MPTSTSPRVLVEGKPITVQPMPYTITGCPFTTPAGSPLPCVTAIWVKGATRVFASGMPVLLLDSQATSVPNGVPLMITLTQTRVVGS